RDRLCGCQAVLWIRTRQLHRVHAAVLVLSGPVGSQIGAHGSGDFQFDAVAPSVPVTLTMLQEILLQVSGALTDNDTGTILPFSDPFTETTGTAVLISIGGVITGGKMVGMPVS